MKLLIVEDNQVIRELSKSVIGALADAVAEYGDGSVSVATLKGAALSI
jgi:CheY-like chemotaxis protein